MESYTEKLFNQFLQVDETINKDLLPPTALHTFRNAVLDFPKGAIRARGGFTQKNTNVTTSNIAKVIDTKDEAGNSFFLAGMSTKIQKSSGGAWSDVLTGLTTTGWFAHSQYRDGLIISSESDPPFVLLGAGWSESQALQLPKPNVRSVHLQRVNSAYGDLEPYMSYMYLLVYKSEYGDVSPPSHAFYIGGKWGTGGMMGTTSAQKAFYITNLPIPTDSRVTSKVLYRTEGDGKIFYKVADLAPDTVDFEDNTKDQDLDFSDTPIYVRIPSTAKVSCVHQDRVWLGNISVIEKFLMFTKQPVDPKGSTSTAPSGKVYADVTSYIALLAGNIAYEFEIVYENFGHAIGLTQSKYYRYITTFIDDAGMESDPVISPCQQITPSGSNAWVDVAGIPSNSMNSEWSELHPQVVSRRIYRTKGQNATFGEYDNTYYLVEEQPVNTNTVLSDEYFDIKADVTTSTSGSLVVGRWYLINTLVAGDDFTNVGYVAEGTAFQATGTTPTNWTNGTVVYRLYESLHPNITWASPTPKRFPSAIAFSRISRPATFYLEDIRQIYEDDKDEINALVDDGNGVLVLKTNNIYKTYTTGASEQWYVRRHFADIGCDDHKSLYTKGDNTFFRHNSRVYLMMSGQVPVDISEPKKSTLASYSTTLQVAVTNDWYVLVAEQSSPSNQAILVFDLNTKAWYEFPFSSKTLQAVVAKKFDLSGYVVGSFYPVMNKIMYTYDNSIYYDNYGGSNVNISVTIGLPAINLQGHPYKIRRTIVNLTRMFANAQITFSFYDLDQGGSLVTTNNNSDATNGAFRVLGAWSNVVSSRMYVMITGYLQQLNWIRFDVRPKRKGL